MYSKIVALFLPLLAVANPVPAQGSAPAPDPSQIVIVDSSYSGNGCPQGSVSTSTSTDKTVITYGFDQFQTYIGPGIATKDNSRACQLHLNLKYPGGFQYAVVSATYHGWARMDKGITGDFITSYYFSQDAGKTSTTRMTATGGGALANGQVYTKQDNIETTAVVWSPCGTNGILNVNNRISLRSSNSSAYGELSNDDATIAFTQQVHVSWQPCTPKRRSVTSPGDTIGIGNVNADVEFN
ncbi:secreted protein [Paraphaeosphaeria minitans]|uniref:Secreted protein n=1 Tax=Paraphaeosphaeria minitans TaxID=565426 RepID=A0A9P6GJD3_9PLEO|nr:secreted protein [Paraphaeosphaeria minitans]